ncbi:MAG: RidA family protein [Verrucomicrobiales bacterium]|nr:RidA family protein [Verrucomicrobiales bacterium]
MLAQVFAVVAVLGCCGFVSAEMEYFSREEDSVSFAVRAVRNDLAFTRQILAQESGDGAAMVEELRRIAGLCDASLKNVVRLNVYIGREVPELRSTAEALIEEFRVEGNTPAVSIIPGKLPRGALLGIDAVLVLKSRSDEISFVGRDAGIAPARKGIVFASGRVAKAKTYAESIPEMHKLVMGDTEHLGVSEDDIVAVRAFINDFANWEKAEAEIASIFGERTPPVVFLEWEREDTIEVEYIFATPASTTDEPVIHHFPNTPKASPSFSRGSVVHSKEIIFMGAMFGEPGDPEKEVVSLLDTVVKNAEEAGSDVDHLAKTTYFVNDSEVDKAAGPVRPKYYHPDTPPAASKIRREHVGLPGHHISMDMIAVPVE